MAELVDAGDLKSLETRSRAGSNPAPGTAFTELRTGPSRKRLTGVGRARTSPIHSIIRCVLVVGFVSLFDNWAVSERMNGSMTPFGGSVVGSAQAGLVSRSVGRIEVIGEFDPGSERTLAACLTHASRTRTPPSGGQ